MRKPTRFNLEFSMDVSIRISGLTGQGIEFATELISEACAREGLNVSTYRSFPTIVRGDYTFSEIRVSDEPGMALPDRLDVLVLLDESGFRDTEGLLTPESTVIADEGHRGISSEVRLLSLPLLRAAREVGSRPNMIVAGFILGLLGLPPMSASKALERRVKIREALEANMRGLERGHRIFSESGIRGFALRAGGRSKTVIQGADLVALAALSAGCRFFAGYPITPSTSIMERLMRWMPEVGGTAVQVEDELSAINMIIGASYAGARAMTTTSGPGLSLMIEGIGLAAMAEIPVVIVDVQRVGPSTGLPTAHEQSDVDLATHPSHGDVPRIVLAPSTIEEYYTLTFLAFELADKFRCPVILLLDQAYTMNYFSIDGLEVDPPTRRKHVEVSGDSLQVFPFYGDAVDGIASPPLSGYLVVASSVEHDVRGLSSPTGWRHVEMSRRRMGKMMSLEENPVVWEVLGDTGAEEAVISLGTCRYAVEESLRRISGRRIMHIPLKQLWPVPRRLGEVLKDVRKVYVVEQNASGQLLNLISSKIPGGAEVRGVRKFDGSPFRPREILKELAGGGC